MLYSTLLPVRKRDIVKARTITVMILQWVFILLSFAILPFAQDSIKSVIESDGQVVPGLSVFEFIPVLGFSKILNSR